jgi:hypothetical protein
MRRERIRAFRTEQAAAPRGRTLCPAMPSDLHEPTTIDNLANTTTKEHKPMKSPALDPVAVARLKRYARCPDCDSGVHVEPKMRPPYVLVRHDDTCPAYGALSRHGRTRQAILIDQGAEDFHAAAADLADALAATGTPMRVASSPYTDMTIPTARGGTDDRS